MRILLALTVLAIIAYFASSRRLWRLRRGALGAVALTSGWAAVACGFALGPAGVGLVGELELPQLQPLIQLGLAWVGLVVGFQAHRTLPRLLPPGTLRLTLLDAGLSAAGIVGAAWLVLRGPAEAALEAAPGAPGAVVALAPALLLAACGLGWAADARSLRGDPTRGAGTMRFLRSTAGLSALLAVPAYGFVLKLATHDPALARVELALALGLVVSVGIALAGALMVRWMMAIAQRHEGEFLVALLGVAAFVAGGAAVLGYSPLFVSLVMGMGVVNMPGGELDKLKRVVLSAEQPIAMLLLLLAGAMLDPQLGRTGLQLLLAVIGVRLAVKLLLGAALRRPAAVEGAPWLALAPLRQAPLAVILALGYAVAVQGRPAEALLSGGQLIAVVAVTGLVLELASLAPLVARRRAAGAKGAPS